VNEKWRQLEKPLQSNTKFKPRTFSLIAFNVALVIEPESQGHKNEICEANHIGKGG
jgi:hypothetical protein